MQKQITINKIYDVALYLMETNDEFDHTTGSARQEFFRWFVQHATFLVLRQF